MISKHKTEFDRLKAWRSGTWDVVYNLLAQYFNALKGPFTTSTVSEGQFLNDGSVYSSSGTLAARLSASAITSAVWKDFKHTVKLRPLKFITDNQANKDFYSYFNNAMAKLFDDSSFLSVLSEIIHEWVIYGTGAIVELPGESLFKPFDFKSFSITGLYPVKGKNGRIDTVYCKESTVLSDAIATYGAESFSPEVQAIIAQGDLQKPIVLVHRFSPRPFPSRIDSEGKLLKGTLGMPYESVVFEEDTGYEVTTESYANKVVHVIRCFVLPGETMGRSMGMDALPTVMRVNATEEEISNTAELLNRPPTWSLNNAVSGSGVIDLSPGANNTFDFMGGISSTPIAPIFSAVDPTALSNTSVRYEQQLHQHFYIDKLYDINAPVRRTLGEVELHRAVTSAALSPLYKKLFEEGIRPCIESAVDRTFATGLLGVFADDIVKQEALVNTGIVPRIIPDEIAKVIKAGFDFYSIDFISPAALIMRSDEFTAVNAFLSIPVQLAQGGLFEGMDRVNIDKIMDALPDLVGVDESFLGALEEAKMLRENRAQGQQAQAQAQQEEQAATANMKNAQAESMLRGQQTNAFRSIQGVSTAQ